MTATGSYPQAGSRSVRFARQSVVREVPEESGISIECTGLTGVDSDPTHSLTDPDDTIHQELAFCATSPMPPTTADQPCPDEIETETDAAAWFNTTEIADLTTHPAMPSATARPLLRLQQYPDLHDDELGSTDASGAKTRTI